MIWADWCIAGVLAISVLVGVFRGFTRELLGLLSWVFAIWLSWAFGSHVAPLLKSFVHLPSLRTALAYGLLFFGGILFGALLTAVFSRLVQQGPLEAADRIAGGGFGLIRGALLVAAAIGLAGMTAFHEDPWWRQSLLIGRFETLGQGLARLIPERWRDAANPSAAPSTETPAGVSA